MVAIREHLVQLAGIPTGQGFNVFYTADTDGFPAMVREFYFGLASYFPDAMTINVPGDGRVIEDSTGVQTGVWTEAAPAAVDCTGAGDYAAGVGAVCGWQTSTVVGGRLLRGRTFIVPLLGTKYDTDGTLDVATHNFLLSSASSLIQDAGLLFKIWHRPVAGAGGSSAFVTNRKVTDKVAFLKSRRS